MKKLGLMLVMLGLLTFIRVQVEAQTQPTQPPASGSRLLETNFGDFFKYDPATVVTVSGTVAAVKPAGRRKHLYLDLQTPQGGIRVFLGPLAYLEQQPVRIAAGDVVEVTGSQVATKSGKRRINAARVKKGGQVLQLRDAAGRPLWSKK